MASEEDISSPEELPAAGVLDRMARLLTGLKKAEINVNHTIACATILQAVLLAIGAYATYDQWRKHNVLELDQQWMSSEMQARRDRIMSAYIGFNAFSKDQDSQRDLFVQKNNYKDLPALLSMFEQVHQCISSGVCYGYTACEIFSGDAKTLDGIFDKSLRIIRFKLANRSWGTSFHDVIDDCRGYTPVPRRNQLPHNIIPEYMTDDERDTYNEISNGLDEEDSLSYAIINGSCSRATDGAKDNADCPYGNDDMGNDQTAVEPAR